MDRWNVEVIKLMVKIIVHFKQWLWLNLYDCNCPVVIFYSSLMYVSILFTGCSGTTTCPWGSGSPTSGPSCLAAITRKHSKDHRWSAQCQMEHQARGTVPDPVQPPGRTADRACSCRRRRGERRQPNRELWRPVFGRSASVWYYAWGGCQNAWQGKAKKCFLSQLHAVFILITLYIECTFWLLFPLPTNLSNCSIN